MKPLDPAYGEPPSRDDAWLALSRFFVENAVNKGVFKTVGKNLFEQFAVRHFRQIVKCAKEQGGLSDQAIFGLLCKAEELRVDPNRCLDLNTVDWMETMLRTEAAETPCTSKESLKERILAQMDASRAEATREVEAMRASGKYLLLGL
jgi:hypothetical protein